MNLVGFSLGKYVSESDRPDRSSTLDSCLLSPSITSVTL